MAAARKIISRNTSVTSCIDVAKQVVRQYITLNLPDSSVRPSANKGSTYGYGLDLNLGLLWYGFHESVWEGDGDRIIRYWRFFCQFFTIQDERTIPGSIQFISSNDYAFSTQSSRN